MISTQWIPTIIIITASVCILYGDREGSYMLWSEGGTKLKSSHLYVARVTSHSNLVWNFQNSKTILHLQKTNP